MTSPFIVREAEGTADMDAVRRLVLAHADARGTTPGVEQIRADAVRLPGPYVPPRGGIWIAVAGDSVIGCVALQPLPAGVGEVKRMFVDEEWRGRGVGRALLERLVESARTRGHREIRLGTLPEMIEAQTLYRSVGFVPIAAYRSAEIGHPLFFSLALGE
ncbi:MAG TPA: GNAT family N-acetyltransferase [Gemmatimonadaceae bacterium]|jgi:GNAT superfamily N-acetyltransferase|nr:GNAT family N-acetyltransferase [Gemmatimonadaceae bacterium]